MNSTWSEKGTRISRKDLELLRELQSGVDAWLAQDLLEKGDSESCSAGESSRGYRGHPAHQHCPSPLGSNFYSVPSHENKQSSDRGEERVCFSLIVCALFSSTL